MSSRADADSAHATDPSANTTMPGWDRRSWRAGSGCPRRCRCRGGSRTVSGGSWRVCRPRRGGCWRWRRRIRRVTLAQIAAANKPLYKGYLIKEQIREAFKVKGERGKT